MAKKTPKRKQAAFVTCDTRCLCLEFEDDVYAAIDEASIADGSDRSASYQGSKDAPYFHVAAPILEVDGDKFETQIHYRKLNSKDPFVILDKEAVEKIHFTISKAKYRKSKKK